MPLGAIRHRKFLMFQDYPLKKRTQKYLYSESEKTTDSNKSEVTRYENEALDVYAHGRKSLIFQKLSLKKTYTEIFI